MAKPLHTLIVEDSEDDALLVVRELKRGEFDPLFERVDTAKAMNEALDKQSWDVVIADYVMPQFSGLDALKLVKKRDLDLPFIVVSGKIGEDIAVDAMKSGAHDYIIKGNLSRLVPAINRELREAEVRRERRRAEETLAKLRKAVETSGEVIFLTDKEGVITYVNPEFTRLYGYSAKEVVGKTTPRILKSGVMKRKDYEGFWRTILNKKVFKGEIINKTKDGRLIDIGGSSNPILDDYGKIVGFLAIQRDITDRKQFEEKLKASADQMRRMLNETIEAIGLISEIRDPYTAGHERRVSKLSVAMAKEMRLSAEQVEGIRVESLLHDFGKVYIPAEILNKPGKLSEIEMNLVKSHSKAGYEILKTIDFPWPVAETVLQHTERYDGSGYPQGLSGDEILLEARILAVADVVEAMSSHRPYRPSLGVKKALEEIEKNAGKLYDPEVVDACMRLFREKGFKLEG